MNARIPNPINPLILKILIQTISAGSIHAANLESSPNRDACRCSRLESEHFVKTRFLIEQEGVVVLRVSILVESKTLRTAGLCDTIPQD